MTVTQTATTTVPDPIDPAAAKLRRDVRTGGRTPGALPRQNGAAIRSLREKDGWHQPEFARKVGMSQSALSNIEREKRSARPATIHRIARALRVPVAAITRDPFGPDGPAALSRSGSLRSTAARPSALTKNVPAKETNDVCYASRERGQRPAYPS